MKTRLLILLIFLGFQQISAQTQTIIGKVTDALTKEGLPGANVKINPGNYGAATDLDGNFFLKSIPFGRYSITISYIGFQTKVIQALELTSAKQLVINVSLEEEVFTSEGVTITAQPNRSEVQNLFTQVSAISFSVEETRRFAGALDDPLRAAAVFPGVVQSGDVNSNGIVVRGSSPKSLQWRLNGVRIPNPNHFGNVGRSDGGVTIFSTQLLANSDFLTSAFPAEYGNTAGGIFDIRFRKGNEQQREHSVQLGIQGIDVATEGPIGNEGTASYLINYRYSVFGFLQYIEPDMKGKVPEYQDLNISLNWQHKNLGSFNLFGIAGTDKSSAKPEKDGKNTIEERADELLNNKVGVLGLQHSLTFGKSSALNTNLSYVGRDVSFRKGLRDSSFTYNPQLNTNQLNYSLALDQSLTHKISSNFLFQIGYRAAIDGFETFLSKQLPENQALQTIADESGTTNNVESFVQAKYSISKNLSINGGLHSMYYVLTDAFTLEPRLSAKWDFLNGNFLALAYGNHAQTEDLSVYLANINGETNKDLKPIRANHYSGTFGFTPSKAIHAQIDAYFQQLYDVPIVANSYVSLLNHPGGLVSDIYQNNGKAYSYGVEFMLEHFFLTDYYYMATVSWNKSEYKDGAEKWRNSRYSSGLTLTALGGKEWRFSTKRTLILNVRATRTKGEYFMPIDVNTSKIAETEVLNAAEIYENRLPDFLYFDMSLGIKTNHTKSTGEWSIQLKNMLNQRPNIGFSYNEVTQKVEEMRPLGIIPIVAYRLSF